MPSFISSSESAVPEVRRDIPARAWLSMALVALAVNLVLLGAWELHVRSLGYVADLEDTPALWARQRERARNAGPEQLVLVGASRTLFDLDLDVLQQANEGVRPIQLATVGSNPDVILTHLAQDESYAGTTLVGVVPPLFAVPAGPPVSRPQAFVKKYETWSPADSVERALSEPLQERLAFIQQDDLTLKQLVDSIQLPNRPGAHVPPLLPPSFSHIARDRRVRMATRVERDAAFRDRIRHIWLPLFTPPPKPDVFTDAQWAKLFADAWDAILARTKRNVASIRARGGRVIFVRHPSDGALRALEDKFAPRAAVWDRLLAETGAAGVFDQDDPELASFHCPEWSHLSASDSVRYTERLVEILRARGILHASKRRLARAP
jgi:hypothetical protein